MNGKFIAYHLDLKHGLWSLPYLEQLVDQLAAWGYNALVVEIEDNLQFTAAPHVAAGHALTASQMAAFSRHCHQRKIDVIPLVQSLGHAEYVVGKPEYAHLRESPHIATQYDPFSEEARQLIMRLFDEAIAATGTKTWFHIGGDETWSLGSSDRAKAYIEKHGMGSLYMQHILPLCEHIHRQGLRPMIWADMFLTYPELLKQVPDYALLVDWDYWTTQEHPEQIMIWGGYAAGHRNATADARQYPQAIRRPGFKEHLHPYAQDEHKRFKAFYCTDALLGHGVKDVIVAPANSCAGDLPGSPRNHVHIPNCWHATRKGMRDARGVLVTSWSVRHAHHEIRQLGTFAAAQAVHQQTYDFDAICLAYSKDMHGQELADYPQAVHLAGQAMDIMQASSFVASRKSLLAGDDEYSRKLEQQIIAQGGRKSFLAHCDTLRQGYLQARDLFAGMVPQARRNEQLFEYWLEGLDLSILHIDFIIAMVDGTLASELDDFARRIAQGRQRTQALFAPTVSACGLEENLQVRYGFHEMYLEKLDAAVAAR